MMNVISSEGNVNTSNTDDNDDGIPLLIATTTSDTTSDVNSVEEPSTSSASFNKVEDINSPSKVNGISGYRIIDINFVFDH